MRVVIADLPDQDGLVAEVWNGHDLWGEAIEVVPGGEIRFICQPHACENETPMLELLEALQKAYHRLSDMKVLPSDTELEQSQNAQATAVASSKIKKPPLTS